MTQQLFTVTVEFLIDCFILTRKILGLGNFLTGRCIYFNRTFRPDKCSNKTRSVLFKRTGWVRIWYMKMSLTEIRTWNRLISFVRYRLIHTVDNLQAQRFICLQQQAVAFGQQLLRFYFFILFHVISFSAETLKYLNSIDLIVEIFEKSEFQLTAQVPFRRQTLGSYLHTDVFKSTVRFSINLNPLVLEKRFSWTTYSSITD